MQCDRLQVKQSSKSVPPNDNLAIEVSSENLRIGPVNHPN